MWSPLTNKLEWTRISDSKTESASARAAVRMYFEDNALLSLLKHQLEFSEHMCQCRVERLLSLEFTLYSDEGIGIEAIEVGPARRAIGTDTTEFQPISFADVFG